jgi:hypothetical protein
LTFANQVQNEIDWWIFWGRVAGGLNRNQQVDVFQRISPQLLPKFNKKPPRINSSLLREMWRTASSLELLPVQTRTQLGDSLLEKLKKGEMVDTALWCLSRLGARKLFYGPNNQVLPAMTATRWMEAIVKLPNASDAVLSLARVTGDGTRDLSVQAVDAARRAFPDLDLEADDSSDMRQMGKIFGEELPAGLVLQQGGE